MSQSSASAGDGHGPWWESDISTVTASASPSANETVTRSAEPADPSSSAVDATIVDLTARRAASPAATFVAPTGGITGRGTFLVMVVAAAVGGLIGFVVSGLTVVPPLTGYGLIIGSLIGAITCSPRLGWFPVAFPPLALFAVVLVLGQVTLIGSGVSLTRELTMVLATLTAQAPAQLVSVALVWMILAIRRRRRR